MFAYRTLTPTRRWAAVFVGVLVLATACAEDPSAPETSPPVEDAPGVSANPSEKCALASDTEHLLTILESITAEVERIGDEGRLNHGHVRALTRHLENLGRHVEGNRPCPAQAARESFRNLIMNYREAGFLVDRDVAELLAPLRLFQPAPPQSGDAPESYAPGVAGELRSMMVDGEELRYEVIDGLAIYQSDIILGYADEFEAGVSADAVDRELPVHASGVCRLGGSIFFCDAWSDGVMGYDFALEGWGAETLAMRTRIIDAIEHWEARAGVRFERRTSGDRVVFRNATGCSSSLGRRQITGFTPQWINLGTNCALVAVIHEIGHAVGLYHEQSRRDRDMFVRVFPERIQDDQDHNFDRYPFDEGRDVGPYDYTSIMHYSCGAWALPGAGNTLQPIQPGITCSDLGRQTELSDGDILGAFSLYPPRYEITGASPGDADDRFELGVVASRLSLPRSDFVRWSSDRVSGTLATGYTLSTAAAGLNAGDHVITASVTILGVTVATRSISITVLPNSSPVVDLGPDRDEDLNLPFAVTASVSDDEDGACPTPVCTYSWSPEPEVDRGPRAEYRFTTEGSRAISLSVEDGGGAVTTTSIQVNVVNTAPAPVIVTPTTGSEFSVGSEVPLSGYADDINEPGGELACSGLRWSSNDASDDFDTSFGCTPVVTFGDPGPRTIQLLAADPQSNFRTTTVDVEVVACGASCRPDASFVIEPDPELDGSIFSPPFSGPGYLLTTELTLRGSIFDADVPPDNPIEFWWELLPPCVAPEITPCPPAVPLDNGSVVVTGFPALADLTFRPGDHVAAWADCQINAREYTIQLTVRDATGAVNSYSRPVHLACDLI